MQDLSVTDGYFILNPSSALVTGAVATLTRNAAGNYSLNWGASVSPIIGFNVTEDQVIRVGQDEDLQEQFGGGGIFASAEPQGRPPFTGMNPITPRTGYKTKGFQLTGMQLIYGISGAALTSISCRLDRTIFQNNQALAISPIIASATNGLQTAVQANPYVTSVANLPAQPFIVTDMTTLFFEVAPIVPASGAFVLYGLRVLFNYNYN
jgi:hypothetical protein